MFWGMLFAAGAGPHTLGECPKAQSPHLNLIENIWKNLSNKVMAKKPITGTEKWRRLKEEWTKITTAQCDRLVMSCGHRCAEVIQTWRNKNYNLSEKKIRCL